MRWKGALARKIRPHIVRPQGLAVTDIEAVARANKQMIDLHQQAVEKERDEKLALLAKHYGVDAGDYRGLTLKLADEFRIPGFQVEPTLFQIRVGEDGSGLIPSPKKGRRTEWPPERLDKLVAAVKEIKKKHRLEKDLDALLILKGNGGEWAAPSRQRGGRWIKTLQNQLSAARKIHNEANKWRNYLKTLPR
jgi:hypothetical protein